MVSLKVFSSCDGTVITDDSKINLKKKKVDSFCDFTIMEKVIYEYCKELETEITSIPIEIKNLDSKGVFCSKEVIYEKLEFEETHKEKTGNPNYFSTRCKQYTNPFAGHFEFGGRGGYNKRIPIFDFQIKKMDHSSYEKMVID
jgi:hypothetical protein